MNVVLFAWCPSSSLYIDALAAAGAPPRLVVTGAGTDARSPIAIACDPMHIPLDRRDDIAEPVFVARIRDIPVDLLLVAGCARILGPELIAAARIGALNFHPSRLPDYRGRQPLFWALFHAEATVGITVHHLTAEIDAGPILLQRDVAVPRGATSASLAPLVDEAGAALIPEVLALAAAGRLPEGVCPTRPGSHFPPLRPEHGLLDFTRSAEEIDCLVRAARGEIPAYCFYRGMRLVVLQGEPAPARAGVAPGRIAGTEGDALAVGAASGIYLVRGFLFLDRIYDGPALAAALGIQTGDALSANPAY